LSIADESGPTPRLDQAVRGLQALLEHPHLSGEYVRFRIDLLKAQGALCRVLDARAPSAAGAAPPRVAPPGAAQARRPALNAEAVTFDTALLVRLALAIRDALRQGGRQSAEAERLCAAGQNDAGLLAEVARCAAFGGERPALEGLARRAGVSVDALLFFGRALAAPFVAVAARRLAGTGCQAPAAEPSPGCPVCGSPPGLAELQRDGGRRVLHCGLCGSTWFFSRLACPHCGCRERDNLAFLRVNDGDPRWIEACERCKRYVKTVDARRLPAGENVDAAVEEAATLHLDLLAEKEGYARGVPSVAPVW